ncbi:pilin [Patescibacteria group bacterium]|nr:pilin [Patescibacteria group bacterium]MBU4099258.1 pilin [Patescibacteria group bacterium]
MVECTAPPASTPVVLPPPIPAACLELKDGVCIKVGTSIFQGGDKGDILTEPAQLITRIFTIILGFAGGIALLLIIFAGYKIIMSKGKPEAIQQGREQLTSAIVGLVFIIFSFVIFQLVFVDILKIPGII